MYGQEYITTPLLLDPNEVSLSGVIKPQNELKGHKVTLALDIYIGPR